MRKKWVRFLESFELYNQEELHEKENEKKDTAPSVAM
jgi:hypothetical protein